MLLIYCVLCFTWTFSNTLSINSSKRNVIDESKNNFNTRYITKREVSHYGNHPPLEEHVPVSIVYDDSIDHVNSRTEPKNVSDRSRKGSRNSRRLSTSSSTQSSDIRQDMEIETIATTTVKVVNVEITKPESNGRNLSDDNKDSDVKIPVSVIYDEGVSETKHVSNAVKPDPQLSQVSKNNRDRSRRRKVKNNPQTLNNSDSSTIHQSRKGIGKKEELNSDRTTNFTRKSNSIRQRDPIIPIVESNNHVYSHSGSFHYNYEGGNGLKAYQNGELKSFQDDQKGAAYVGGYSYKDKDGNDFMVSYTADENGYRPVGAHLPTPPPIPPAIARALRYLATKTTPEPVTEAMSKKKQIEE